MAIDAQAKATLVSLASGNFTIVGNVLTLMTPGGSTYKYMK
jgi:hypothetical protein